jgi:hypothetical protein
MDQAPELVVLFSNSQTLDGCDRVFLVGDEVITQGKRTHGRADLSAISVPPDETLNVISVRSFLAAARELERRLGSS